MTETIYSLNEEDFTDIVMINIGQLEEIIRSSDIVTALLYSNYEQLTESTFTIDIVFEDVLSGGDEIIFNDIITDYTYSAYADKIAILKDVKSVGTNGGDFTYNVWTTRVLNTLLGDMNFCTLNSNQFTLVEGSYSILAKAPVCNVQSHQTRLQNITDSSTVELGTSGFSTNGIVNISELLTTITITESTTYEIQHICELTVSGIGLGRATGFNTNEVYSTVIITKLN